jgi:DNA-binding response OmpR family regulator
MTMADLEKRILIIDPDGRQRKDLAAFLEKESYYVETGKGLPEALKKVSAGGFSCLVMDVNLPEMKGYEAVSIIKSIDPGIKIIMTTKKNSKSLEAKVRKQDIFFYFIKSFGKEELKLAIKNAFGNYKEEKMDKQKAKILVIDDDQDFLNAMTPILESALYDVVTALNPEEAKKKIFSEKPDLILLDIMMDSLFDGFSLCHAIKAAKEYKDFKETPIIFVSAVKEKTGSRFQFKGEELGMVGPDDYIDKPVKPEDLLARIERLLKK